jgi:hypothetical protein
MPLSEGPGSRLIFLSHSGRDKDLAERLPRDIERMSGYWFRVFNTSDSGYRFAEWKASSRVAGDSRAAAAEYENKLRAYLSDKIADSSAYLLLVTPESTAGSGSDWVRWEVGEATALANRNHGVFIPVFVGAGFDPHFLGTIFPREASMFQGISLDYTKPEELNTQLYRLCISIRRRFEEGPESRQD